MTSLAYGHSSFCPLAWYSRNKDGGWRKKPDERWKPDISTDELSIRVVFEIGIAESAQHLELIAHGWLETAGSTTEIAFMMIANRDVTYITIQRRECNSDAQEAISVETLTMTLTDNMFNVSGDLTLPFRTVVGRDVDSNSEVEKDLRITRLNSQCCGACLGISTFYAYSYLS